MLSTPAQIKASPAPIWIAPARAKTILAEVEAAVATWRKQGKALGMTSVELDQFADAFEHEERQAAQRVAAGG